MIGNSATTLNSVKKGDCLMDFNYDLAWINEGVWCRSGLVAEEPAKGVHGFPIRESHRTPGRERVRSDQGKRLRAQSAPNGSTPDRQPLHRSRPDRERRTSSQTLR